MSVPKHNRKEVVGEGEVNEAWNGCVPVTAVCDLLGYLRCHLRLKRLQDCAEKMNELISKDRFRDLTDVNDADWALFRRARCSHPNTRSQTRGGDSHHEPCSQRTRTLGAQSSHAVRTDCAIPCQDSVLCAARHGPAQRTPSSAIKQERYSWFVPIDDENTGCVVNPHAPAAKAVRQLPGTGQQIERARPGESDDVYR